MKNDILNKLALTINALNNVSVHGKSNLDNLGGSIAMLYEIQRIIEATEISSSEAGDQQHDGAGVN